MKTKLAALLAAAIIAVAGCGGGGDGDINTMTNDAQTGSADVPDDGKLGEPVDLGDDTTITLSNPRVFTEDSTSNLWIDVDVRFVNDSSEVAQTSMVEVVCHEATSGDGWVATSTYEPGADVRPGEAAKGVLSLTPTGNSMTGDPIPECAGPAHFDLGSNNSRIPVPDEVLDEYNAAIPAANKQIEKTNQEMQDYLGDD